MNVFLMRITLLAVLSLCGGVSNAQTLRATFTPIANFAYQLDCVAKIQRNCAGVADYTKLWRETLKIDPETSPEVRRWVALREKHQTLSEPRFSGDKWPYERVTPTHRVLAAGLGARDLADYQSRLALVLPDVSIAQAHTTVAALYAPFESWWNAVAQPKGGTTAEALIRGLENEKIKAEKRHIFLLLGSPESARTEAITHLMYRPGVVDADQTSGQNMGVVSFAEFVTEESTALQLAVIVHEYAHFVFSSIPREKGIALQADIIRAGGAVGGSLWGLFNEAQASAIGNGRTARAMLPADQYAKYLAAAGSFYARELIDGAGKALLPLFDEMIAAGGTVFDELFPARYARAVRARLGEALAAPSSILSEFRIIFDPMVGGRWMSEVVRITRAGSIWSEMLPCCDAPFQKQFDAWKDSTRVIVLPLRDVHRAVALPVDLRAKIIALQSDSASVIAVQMTETAPPLIVIAANDATGATAGLEALMNEKVLASKVWRVGN